MAMSPLGLWSFLFVKRKSHVIYGFEDVLITTNKLELSPFGLENIDDCLEYARDSEDELLHDGAESIHSTQGRGGCGGIDSEPRQTLERLREVSEIPVVMLTAAAQERDKVKDLKSGADDYITKPLSKDELLARV